MLKENTYLIKKPDFVNYVEEIQGLREENAHIKDKIRSFENIIQETNSLTFIFDSTSDKILLKSDDTYFNTLFEKDFLSNILSGNINSYYNVYHLDKTFLALVSIYLKEQEEESNISGIFRYRSKEGEYIWLYIKIHKYNESDVINRNISKGVLTIFDDNLQSKEQIKTYSISINREKLNYHINDFKETELKIVKYLSDGKNLKDITTLMGFKSLSAVNNIIDDLFKKTKTHNVASLVCFFINLGVI